MGSFRKHNSVTEELRNKMERRAKIVIVLILIMIGVGFIMGVYSMRHMRYTYMHFRPLVINLSISEVQR